ncbi:MAG: DUF29 domain-containing protein [Mesorhizobium sp.]|nr:DUF29 domain-containing protein [Mesorhizobium sp.]MBN9243699.1 DUF29 domain-containing protein [Mesorhizobium sp.]MBN9269529.1 DUF29 domain-containing protein [Mesorhizobium sp.]
MNKIFRLSQLTPYEADYAQWCAEQGALLREGRLADLDRKNLAEEIESLGRSDKREIEHRLKVLLVHLIKYKLQPKGRSGSWRATVKEQRFRIAKVLRESPSLRDYPAEVLAEEYSFARPEAAMEANLDEALIPEDPPFTAEQVLDQTFLPD